MALTWHLLWVSVVVLWVVPGSMRHLPWLGRTQQVFVEAAGGPWDVWGQTVAEKGMDSGFPGGSHSACPGESRTLSPGEIGCLLSFAGREVTAGDSGPAPASPRSPSGFRMQLFLQSEEVHCCWLLWAHRSQDDQRSSWERRQTHDLGFSISPCLSHAYHVPSKAWSFPQ